jgi:protein associated with RNAse G/E
MAPQILVRKLNYLRQETWQYPATVLQQDLEKIILEAYFDRQDMSLQGMVLAKGDRFLETYYTRRWYNILEIHAREDDHLRGWYCNITTPAVVDGDTVSYVDLALDLLVFPDGQQVVLDEEEFASLSITKYERAKARKALTELQNYFRRLITKAT